RVAIALSIEQHLSQRGEDAHQGARISSAQRCKTNVHGHRRAHNHLLGSFPSKIDQGRLAHPDAGARRGQCSGEPSITRRLNIIPTSLNQIVDHHFRLQSDRLSRVWGIGIRPWSLLLKESTSATTTSYSRSRRGFRESQ